MYCFPSSHNRSNLYVCNRKINTEVRLPKMLLVQQKLMLTYNLVGMLNIPLYKCELLWKL